MTIKNPLLANLFEKAEQFETTMNQITETAAAEDRDMTEIEQANFSAAETEFMTLNKRIEDLTKSEEERAKLANARKANEELGVKFTNGSVVKVGEEPTTYGPNGPSWIADLYRFQTQPHNYPESVERIARHAKEIQFTAVATTDTPEVVPPQYLTDDLLRKAVGKRVVANMIPQAPWIPGTTHHYPRVSAVASLAVRSDETSNLSNSNPDTDEITAAVKQTGGFVDISELNLSQATIQWDRELFTELAEQYAIGIENYVLSDSSKGICFVGGTNSISASTVTTFSALYSKIANGAAQSEAARFNPAEVIITDPRRWTWIKSQLDTTGRPLIEIYGGTMNAAAVNNGGVQGAVGSLFGIPVYTTTQLPSGATPTDYMVVGRLGEARIREQGPQAAFDRGAGFKSGYVTFRLIGNFSFTAERAPAELSVITLPYPSF